MKTKQEAKLWHEQMNDDYAAAKTDAEKLTVLGKYMGPGAAMSAHHAIETGATSSCRDISKDPESDTSDNTTEPGGPSRAHS
jgi:hypothetical protein